MEKCLDINIISTYIICPGLDLSIKSMLILIPKWRISYEQNVEDDTTRPNVHCLAIRLFLQHLGRQITRSSSKTWNGTNTIMSYSFQFHFVINSLPNQACWSPWTSIASPKSASLTAAPFCLLANNRFSGWNQEMLADWNGGYNCNGSLKLWSWLHIFILPILTNLLPYSQIQSYRSNKYRCGRLRFYTFKIGDYDDCDWWLAVRFFLIVYI